MNGDKRIGNIKALFQNTRSRTILIFTLIVVILFVLIGVFSLRSRIAGPESEAEVGVGGPKGIQSVPGGFEVSEQYAKLQEQADIERAKQAEQAGTSAIPTITRATRLGEGGLEEAKITGPVAEGVGFEKLQLDQEYQKSAWYQDIIEKGCTPENVKKARAEGATAKQLKEAGCTASQLLAGGFSPAELQGSGFTSQELAGVVPAGFTVDDLKKGGCSVESLKKAKAAGVNASTIKQTLGCSAAELRAAGFTVEDLRNAGYSDDDIRTAGYSDAELGAAGIFPALPPAIVSGTGSGIAAVSEIPTTGGSDEQIQQIIARQEAQISAQQSTQAKQQLQAAMATQAGQLFTSWNISTQEFVLGTPEVDKGAAAQAGGGASGQASGSSASRRMSAMIKAGDILFAVLETAVDSDEPGPILATVVEGKYKGATLVGSLQTFPPYGQKVTLNFDQMSIKGYPSSIPVSAVAIDPKTARTALSNDTNNHYLLRYGTLFASAFLQGYGQAFNDSGSTTTIQTDGSTTQTRGEFSPKEKIAIGFGTVGQNWGQQLAPIFNTPPTVKVYSGVGLGILFLKDVSPSGV